MHREEDVSNDDDRQAEELISKDTDEEMGGAPEQVENEPNDMDVGCVTPSGDAIRELEICLLVSKVGGDGKKYRRVQKQGIKKMVSEIYSPPRATELLKRMPRDEVAPGFALDLTTTNSEGQRWDFDRKEMRDKARQLVMETEPILLIGSPMRTAFCTWQNLTNTKRDPGIVQRGYARAMVHIRFVMELYKLQQEKG